MKKYLISYGDDNYALQRDFFRDTALYSSFFDEVKIFTPEDIDIVFANHLGERLKAAKGGGYWLWKPYLIKKVLDSIELGDVLVYCDAGCVINVKGEKRFKEYIDLLFEAKTGTLDFELPHREYEYTAKKVFDHFNSSDEIINSSQLIATVLLVRKCSHTIMLIDKWYQTAYSNPSLFTDEKNVIQLPGFIDHRHDQSVFSVIRKTYGANIFPDETYYTDFIRDGANAPFWATRLKG